MNRIGHAVLAATLALAAGLPQKGMAQDAGTVLARVNSVEITLGHVIAVMARLPQQFQDMPDDVLFDGILNQLVEQTAVAEGATEPFSLRARIDLENNQREALVNDQLTRVADAAVTDDALQSIYAERYLGAEPESEFNAAHILVETEDEALSLLEEYREGADFADLAREHSLDPGSAARGGDLGWFGTGMMVPPFEEAVLSLEPGAVSDPVETQFGWHLVLLLDTRLVETPEFDEVRDTLAQELQSQAVLDHIAEARENATIELLDEGIDPALIRDQSLLQD